ncbi:uncharacterized protein LOC110069230 [Orbicella faveolata]|uniref:uncharacterized protein LOC110069230 n=1 Tax=Orbicella faveolata TaxID=48498 RepID=UPI0009E232F7|nr:uncharacterized protein LOC110069230 [Orbicella faveolata]
MVYLKEFVSVCLLIAFLLTFTSARKDKELAALNKKVDKVRRFLLLHAWMQSERETSRRSKRATKSRRRAKFRLPYFPLYPIDVPVCKDAERESKSGMCKSWAKSGYCEKVKYVMSRYCPKECKYCKQFSPPGCQSGKYGCCWNNLEARGPNGRGCPVCRDSYGRLCRLFEYYCPKPGKYGQFVRYHCFKTCGWCDKFAQLRNKQASDAL